MVRPESGSLTAEAHARLRAEILACRLPPGQKLVIAELCDQLWLHPLVRCAKHWRGCPRKGSSCPSRARGFAWLRSRKPS